MTIRGHLYFYETAKFIPKDRVVYVTSEGSYRGRVHGDKDYMIIAWNGTDFTVLEHMLPGELRAAMKKYRGMAPDWAIILQQHIRDEQQAILDARPKCACGKPCIALYDDQPDGVCCECFLKGH